MLDVNGHRLPALSTYQIDSPCWLSTPVDAAIVSSYKAVHRFIRARIADTSVSVDDAISEAVEAAGAKTTKSCKTFYLTVVIPLVRADARRAEDATTGSAAPEDAGDASAGGVAGHTGKRRRGEVPDKGRKKRHEKV